MVMMIIILVMLTSLRVRCVTLTHGQAAVSAAFEGALEVRHRTLRPDGGGDMVSSSSGRPSSPSPSASSSSSSLPSSASTSSHRGHRHRHHRHHHHYHQSARLCCSISSLVFEQILLFRLIWLKSLFLLLSSLCFEKILVFSCFLPFHAVCKCTGLLSRTGKSDLLFKTTPPSIQFSIQKKIVRIQLKKIFNQKKKPGFN